MFPTPSTFSLHSPHLPVLYTTRVSQLHQTQSRILIQPRLHRIYCAYLGETDIRALFPEALTADVEAVLADQTCGVRADAAESRYRISFLPYYRIPTLSTRVGSTTFAGEEECHTMIGRLCRSCGDASTRRIRETWSRLLGDWLDDRLSQYH